MVIYGDWLLDEDGTARPIVRGEVLASDGSWIRAPFLLDTGADCTVFSQSLLALLGLPGAAASDRVAGLGGAVASVTVDTQIRLTRENGGKVTFRGAFTAVTDLETLDLSVLGRDITGLFAVIVDRPGDTICLVGQRHRYAIVAA
jgi:Aspartyl protease